jgi:hypothetical protein
VKAGRGNCPTIVLNVAMIASRRALIALGTVMAVSAWAGPARFPSGDHLLSPNGLWKVHSEEIQSSQSGAANRLCLSRTAAGGCQELLKIERHAAVYWAPASNAVAITDSYASNESDCKVALVEGKLLSVRSYAVQRHAKLLQNSHTYFVCEGWHSKSRLRVRAWGYGQKAFKKRWLVNVSDLPLLPAGSGRIYGFPQKARAAVLIEDEER